MEIETWGFRSHNGVRSPHSLLYSHSQIWWKWHPTVAEARDASIDKYPLQNTFIDTHGEQTLSCQTRTWLWRTRDAWKILFCTLSGVNQSLCRVLQGFDALRFRENVFSLFLHVHGGNSASCQSSHFSFNKMKTPFQFTKANRNSNQTNISLHRKKENVRV